MPEFNLYPSQHPLQSFFGTPDRQTPIFISPISLENWTPILKKGIFSASRRSLLSQKAERCSGARAAKELKFPFRIAGSQKRKHPLTAFFSSKECTCRRF